MNTKNYFVRVLVVLALVLVIGTIVRVSMNSPKQQEEMPSMEINAIGDTKNLVSLSIAPGAILSGEHTVTGVLTGAYFFEANAVGSLVGVDGTVFTQFPISATTDWMTADEVSFTTTFNTDAVTAGPGYLRIANDNPSGEAELSRHIDIPVIFQ